MVNLTNNMFFLLFNILLKYNILICMEIDFITNYKKIIEINKNSALFINKYGLIKYNIIDINEFATRSIIGTFYFIKNNSILQVSCGITEDYIDIRFKTNHILYKATIAIINAVNTDFSSFKHPEIFTKDEDIITYDCDRIVLFIKTLITAGFNVYKK